MQEKDKTRRKVLIGLTSAVGLSGLPFAATPFIAAWNPSAKAKAAGAAVTIEAKHMCMMMRGVEKQNSVMTTSCMLGIFRTKASTRNEYLSLVSK